MKKTLLIKSTGVLTALLLGGCTGYKIGPVTPKYMDGIKSIAVPTFRNNTLIPRVEVLVTNTVIKQFQQDGTFQIANTEKADAILEAKIESIDRTPSRSVRDNIRATREFRLRLAINYVLRDPATNEQITQGRATGETSFFVGSDVNQEERIAIPRAAELAAQRLVSELSEGW
jgi:hypothetical protein